MLMLVNPFLNEDFPSVSIGHLSIALFFIAVAHGEMIKNGPSLQE